MPSNIMRSIAVTVALAIFSPSLLFYAFAYPYQAPPQRGDGCIPHQAPLQRGDGCILYQAPVHRGYGCIPKSYFVFLKPGYPFEKHIAIVRTDKHVSFKAYERAREPAGKNDSYSAKDVDDTLLAIIRSDPGVIKINCNLVFGIPEEEFIDW
jgi:hypothetical protein